MNRLLCVATILVCSSAPAFAMNPARRCAIALTATVTKGPRQALIAWRALANDNTSWEYRRPTARMRRQSVIWQTQILARELGRDVTPQNVVSVARQLIADPATPKDILNEIIASLRHADLLGDGASLIAQLRNHPNLRSPAQILFIASNPTSGLDQPSVAKLVMDIMESQVGEDFSDGDVPRSAHPASHVCELRSMGRLSMADFGRAYVFLIDNPRAAGTSLYWILSFLHLWARELYVHGGALPPRDLSRTLIEKARARLDQLKYSRDILRERVDETERLLGL